MCAFNDRSYRIVSDFRSGAERAIKKYGANEDGSVREGARPKRIRPQEELVGPQPTQTQGFMAGDGAGQAGVIGDAQGELAGATSGGEGGRQGLDTGVGPLPTPSTGTTGSRKRAKAGEGQLNIWSHETVVSHIATLEAKDKAVRSVFKPVFESFEARKLAPVTLPGGLVELYDPITLPEYADLGEVFQGAEYSRVRAIFKSKYPAAI